MNLGKLISEKRNLVGYSKRKLAKETGLSDTVIGFWERGERKDISLYGAYQLTKILPVSLEELAQAVAEEKDNKTGCKASEKEG